MRELASLFTILISITAISIICLLRIKADSKLLTEMRKTVGEAIEEVRRAKAEIAFKYALIKNYEEILSASTVRKIDGKCYRMLEVNSPEILQ